MFGVRVYLKGAVKEAAEFKKFGEDQYFNGQRLWNARGLLYFDLPHHNDNIAEFFTKYVERLTLRETMIGEAERETGIYRHESAEAELSFSMAGGLRIIHVAIEAKKLEDLREILVRIRAGEIRPEKSYEGPQDGMSAEEKAAELNRLNNELVRVEGALNKTCQEIVKQKEATAEAEEKAEAARLKLEAVRRKLVDWRSLGLHRNRASNLVLPFLRKQSAIEEIDRILEAFNE